MRRLRRADLACSAAAAVALVACSAATAQTVKHDATPAHAATPGWARYLLAHPRRDLAAVNALRGTFGAPPLRLNSGFSEDCARHEAYMARNGAGHPEQPGAPGYSAGGALAGPTSVLAFPPADPFGRRSPLGAWAEAPYHQSQILDPLLRVTGFALGCMSTLRGLAQGAGQPQPSRILVWPGQNSHDVPRILDACAEQPSNPFDDVGWSCGGSGTALYVYDTNAEMNACAPVSTLNATLTGPAGVVPTQTLRGAGPCSWLVITGRPLTRHARYMLDVSDGQSTLRRSFYSS